MVPKCARSLLFSALALAACLGFLSGPHGLVLCYGADGRVAISICPVEPCGPSSLLVAGEDAEAAQEGASGSDCCGPCVDVPVAGYLCPPLPKKVATVAPVGLSCFLEIGSTAGRLGGRSNEGLPAPLTFTSYMLVSLRTVVLLV